MLRDGKLTVNAWLLVVFVILIFTTPVNPFIVHRYLPILWYAGVAIYGLWLLAKVTREEMGK